MKVNMIMVYGLTKTKEGNVRGKVIPLILTNKHKPTEAVEVAISALDKLTTEDIELTNEEVKQVYELGLFAFGDV